MPGVRHTSNHPVVLDGFSDGSKPNSRRKSKRAKSARIGCRDGRGEPDAPDPRGDPHLSKYHANFIIQHNGDFENFGKYEIKEFLTIVPRPGQFVKTHCSWRAARTGYGGPAMRPLAWPGFFRVPSVR